MKKLYNFRLDINLINQLDKLDGSRTSNVQAALQSYLQNDSQCTYNINLDYLHHLESEIGYLRAQVNGLMFARFPLIGKLKDFIKGNTR